ncbi:hypothetical protein UPYG_G00196070 [Umbra pygmaea]|uniref:FXYD domain-containing ion transport regulator n=1 Tax=Umbra pygmaea TaxID=75934 RepID=A0ABD0X519_UMBPY
MCVKGVSIKKIERVAMETIMFFLFSLSVYVTVQVKGEEDGEEQKGMDSFIYDYHSLRICGLVFGVILFALGILLILSRKCRCSFNQEKPKAPGDEEATAETLIISKAKEPAPEPKRRREVTGLYLATKTDTHLRGTHTARIQPGSTECSSTVILIHKPATMSAAGGSEINPDADFVYDYETLRTGGLIFAGVLVIVSVFLLTGHKLRRCGKSKKIKQQSPLKPHLEDEED